MIPSLTAPLTSLVLVLGPMGPARTDEPPLAPDGQRGLGNETSLQDVHSLLLRAEDSDEVEFVQGIYSLEGDIRVQIALAREEYRKRGWWALLERSSEDDLETLHAAYRAARKDALAVLAKGGATGRALSEALSDTRFNVRMALVRHFEFEAREVRAGLAVLRASGDGFVTLAPEEARAILTRVDLSSSLLRALRSDLVALRPDGSKTAEPDELLELREIPKLRSKEEREATLSNVLSRLAKREDQMRQALFHTRLLPRIRSLLAWRERQLGQAAGPRQKALEYLPDTPAGRAADASIDRLAKHERMRYASTHGREGLSFDPLDEDLVWAVAAGLDFVWGDRESRTYYDRFLALRGIRAHDHRTLLNRDLNAREERALIVVQGSSGLPPVGR